ncbi:hypothetical protein ING2D1G_0028 [Peptoniphilus sp. ING2-D1G]|nr:hypothetical protein ING2D1G_0028 [Peptoniphilus sp. ING2-D1G]
MKLKNLFILILSLFLLSACSADKEIKEVAELEKDQNDKKVEKTVEEEPEEKFYSPISGLEVEEDISREPIFAIMYDNHPYAIPQSAITDAEVIYEFKVEGQYTRFLALFLKNKPEAIGSVRSARPYFANTAKEYDSIYIHWGGSEAGYATISSDNLMDIDGIAYEGSTFYRNKETKKRRPHDGYTSYDLLYKRAEEKGYLENINNEPFFKFDISEDLEDLTSQMGDKIADSVSLDFFAKYNMTADYDKSGDNYSFTRNGQKVTDEKNNEELRAKNVIIEFASSKITGPKDTLTIDHIGSGTGKLLSRGKIIDITWEKPDATSKTTFKTLSGDEIILNPGLTFVEVIDSEDLIHILPEESTPESEEATNEKV